LTADELLEAALVEPSLEPPFDELEATLLEPSLDPPSDDPFVPPSLESLG
jgi:hypothetical protein